VQLADRIRTALASRKIGAVPDLRVTASFGVVERGSGSDTEELVAAADEALYRAKRAGKDRIERGAAEPSRL
jgi:two-component system, cell cycle response regulator